MPYTPVRDLWIGRLGLPTVQAPIGEQLGSEISTVGDSTAVGQRRVKGFTLVFPVHGDAREPDPYTSAQRMRRQLRSIMQNPAYRLAAPYVMFAFDPERNGWIVIGTANLADADGGATLGEYLLTIDNAFRVAAINTHRDGYRVDLTDLRLTVSPVDILGQIVNTSGDFAGLSALALTALPVGATDLAVLDNPVVAGVRSGRDGSLPVCAGRANGDVVSWERAETSMNLGDVVIYDRRGNFSGAALNTDGSSMTTVWRNLHPNPRAGMNTQYAGVAGAATAVLSRNATDGYQGPTCYQMACSGFTAGDVPQFYTSYVTAQPAQLAYMRCAVKATVLPAGAWIQLSCLQGSNGQYVYSGPLDSNHTPPVGKWIVLEGFATVYPTAGQVAVQVIVQGATAASTLLIADVQITLQDMPARIGEPWGWPPYVAGDQIGCQWLGQAHNSVSVGFLLAANLIANPNAASGTAGWTATATGTATASLTTTAAWATQGSAFSLAGAIPIASSAQAASNAITVYGGHEYVLSVLTNLTTSKLSYLATILGDAPVSYWRQSDTGTTMADVQGANPGTYSGGYTHGTQGAIGASGDTTPGTTYNGTNAIATVPYAATLNTANFTVESWVNYNVASGTFYVIAFTVASNKGWSFFVNHASNLIALTVYNGTAGTTVNAAANTLTPNVWHHVAATYDGANVKLYVDGALVKTTAYSTFAANTTGALLVGNNASAAYFNGALDEVAVYNYALTAAQVTAHYAAAQAGFQLQAQWFDSAGAAIPGETQSATIPAGISQVALTAAAPRNAKTLQVAVASTAPQTSYTLLWDSVLAELIVQPTGAPPSTKALWRGFNLGDWSPLAGGLSRGQQITVAQAANANAVRVPVNVGTDVRASSGAAITWSTSASAAYLSALQAAGLKVILCMLNVPTWATGNGSPYISQLSSAYNANMGQIAAAAIAQWPNIIAIEWGNEVQNPGGVGTSYVAPATYVPQLQAIYSAVHPVGALVLTASMAPDTYANLYNWISGLYTSGAKGYFDAIGIHPYPGPMLWQGDVRSGEVADLIQAVLVARAANTDTKPLWATEYGLTIQAGAFTPYQQQTGLAIMDALLRRCPDVQVQIIHTLNDAPGGYYDYGIIDNFGNQRPAYNTTRALWATNAPPPYFDGDTLPAQWTGVARQSASITALADLQSALGFEEVYGPDYPLIAGDVPILGNGLCRVRYDFLGPSAYALVSGFLIETWGGTGWVEQGKCVIIRHGDAGVTSDTNLLAATVVEWTPDRAVIQATMAFPGDSYSRERVFITLQRGWTGPRIEVYTPPLASGATTETDIRFALSGADTNDSAMKIDGATASFIPTAGTGSVSWASGYLGPATFPLENEVAIIRQGATGWQTNIAVVQSALGVAFLAADGQPYAPQLNNEIAIGGLSGYVSAHLGFIAQATDQINEAEAIRNIASGTTSQITDATASGGFSVRDTQTGTGSNNTLLKSTTTLLQAKYRVFARVKVTASTTGSFIAYIGAVASAILTSSSTTWVWIDLGEVLATAAAQRFAFVAWASTGAGPVYVDRVELFLLEDRTSATPSYAGARDLGQAVLFDSRVETRKVSRG